MNKFLLRILVLFMLSTTNLIGDENIMILKLKDGEVKIELFPDTAPNHVDRIKKLADRWFYGSNWRCKIWQCIKK